MSLLDELARAHRIGQNRIGLQVAADVISAWGILDLADLDGTSPQWLRTSSRLISTRAAESAALAGDYLAVARLVAVGETPARTIVPPLDLRAVETSLMVTGPVSVKRATALARYGAVRHAHINVARSAMRHALSSGRETVMATVAEDPVAIGWRRVAGPGACKFCRMLADRGAVYRAETAGFAAHDGCGCSVEPEWGDSRRQVRRWTGRREDISDAERRGNNARAREFIARMGAE